MAQHFTIDSSVLVSSFLPEDIYFKESQAFFRYFLNLPNSQDAMPILVYLECFKVLARVGFSKSEIQRVKQLFDLPCFKLVSMDRLTVPTSSLFLSNAISINPQSLLHIYYVHTLVHAHCLIKVL